MASIFKRRGSGCWLIVYFDASGRRRQKSSRTTDKRTAERIAAKLEADEALRRTGVIDAKSERLATAAHRPIQELLDEYLDHCTHAGQVADHLLCKRAHLEGLLDVTGCSRLRDVDAPTVEKYLRHLLAKGKAPRTANLCRSAVLAFMNWCQESGFVGEHGLQRLPIQETAGKRRRVRRGLSSDELQRLLQAAKHRDAKNSDRWSSRAAVYCAAAFTGLRRNELANLRWEDVDLELQVIRIRAEIAKSRQAAILPLHQVVVDALRAIKPADAKPLERVFRTMPTAKTFALDLQRAGIPKRDDSGRVVDLHALRTTLATELARQGVAPQVAQRLMRHSDYRITMEHYVTLGLDEAKTALGKLPVSTQKSGQAEAAGVHQTDQSGDSPVSRNDSTRQQNCQQSGHDTVRSEATPCVTTAATERGDTECNSVAGTELCDLVRRDASADVNTPGRNRTCNHQIRSLVLYPIELRARRGAGSAAAPLRASGLSFSDARRSPARRAGGGGRAQTRALCGRSAW